MDRFERSASVHLKQEEYHIYIPIWIDLKAVVNVLTKVCITIYIPIWIDLKDPQSKIAVRGYFDLHSNMDRFERDKAFIKNFNG